MGSFSRTAAGNRAYNAPLFQLTLKLTLPFLGGKRLPKLFVTMVIRNVTLNDDSTYGALGRYECHAFQLVTLWREDMDLVSLSLEVSHLRG